ncbi:bifunctional diguanylate cyclase/phosphodiesterase [Lacrimispora saccharolytica]|uniref:bifunctional diguanylate cyclase/phosphodiesterase n=2 Tax=Lacrimispora saccharolytica TaxID=84030 RepID=UPI000674EE63|nr:EAL domain-containing protein [Lacrimispora saccharolytica]
MLLYIFVLFDTEKRAGRRSIFFRAAKQNQVTLKNRMEGDLHTLKGLAVSLGAMDPVGKEEINRIITDINEENKFMKIGFADNADWMGSNPDDDYYSVPVRNREDQPLGLLYATNPDDILRNMIDETVLSGVLVTEILDQNGMVVAGNAGTKDQEKVREVISKGSQLPFPMDSQGNRQQMAVLIPLEINNWYVLSVFPQSGKRDRHIETGIGALILLSSGLFLYFFCRQYKSINENQEALLELANRDSLTGCRNFPAFKKEAERVIREENILSYAVWYCDIKKFKFINDILGYEEGDRILSSIADLFRDYGEEEALFCRVSADNFAGLHKYETREEMRSWFHNLVEFFQSRELPSYKTITIELCMGVYCMEENDRDLSIERIVNRANIAQKHVKSQPGNQFGFYNKEIRNKVVYESELESEIDRAIRNREFKPFIQPKISIQKGNRIAGGEVLVRWENPRKGTIPPGLFIPLMERDGKIVKLDRYMFEVACQWLNSYLKTGREPVNLAVNVSKIGMLRDDFVDFYGRVKEKYQIPDGLLELEFTETVMLNDDAVFSSLVSRLHKKGFVCSLDDFGSGYSSLNLLKNLPIDVLKLDIMFFRKSTDIKRERIVISNIINMAKELQIRTIAEGVEYVETVDFLTSAGCDVIQGYVFAKPMPIEAFDEMLLKKKGEALIPEDIRV